jgi:drug/metabolite transporter (DMT)-like permease
MTAIGFALAAMVMNGLTDFVFKKAAEGSMRGQFRMYHFIVAQSCVFWMLMMVYGVVSGQLIPGPHMWLGALAGVFMFIGFTSFAWSLRHGSISINAPIFRLNFLVTAALAILLLGEPPVPVKLAGLALALAAIWLLIGSGGGGIAGLSPEARRSLLLAVVATLSLGAGNTVHKVGLSMGGTPATQLATHAFVYLILSIIVTVREDGGLKIPASVWPVAASGATLGACAFVMMMQGLTIGQASVIVPIAQMGLVVSATLGVVVLKERLTGRKLMGLAAAVAALSALAMS